MGLEKTAQQITEDAKAGYAGIIAQANSDAGQILEKARADGKKIADKIISRGQAEAKFAGEKLVTDARMEAGRKKMRMQSELMQKALEKSMGELERFADGKEYFFLLERLAIEALGLLGEKEAVLYVRKKDARHISLKKLSDQAGVQIEFAKDFLDTPGAIVESKAGSMRVDNTFAARMKRDGGELRKIAAETLFEGM